MAHSETLAKGVVQSHWALACKRDLPYFTVY